MFCISPVYISYNPTNPQDTISQSIIFSSDTTPFTLEMFRRKNPSNLNQKGELCRLTCSVDLIPNPSPHVHPVSAPLLKVLLCAIFQKPMPRLRFHNPSRGGGKLLVPVKNASSNVY